MKNIVTAGLVGFVVVFGQGFRVSAAGQAAPSGSARIDDGTLHDRIKASLKTDALLAPRSVDVDVEQGVVTLTGTVRTAEEKATAGRLADVSGVTQVRNRIEIDPKIDQSKIDAAADKTKSGLTKAVDATAGAAKKSKEAVQKGVGKAGEGVAKGADKTAEAAGKVGGKASDASITSGVKASFSSEKSLRDTAIDVDTTDQVVTLRGTVHSYPAKVRAEELAAGTKNVIRVVNELVVRAD